MSAGNPPDSDSVQAHTVLQMTEHARKDGAASGTLETDEKSCSVAKMQRSVVRMKLENVFASPTERLLIGFAVGTILGSVGFVVVRVLAHSSLSP